MKSGWRNGPLFIGAHVLLIVLALVYLYECTSLIRAAAS